MNIPEHLIPPFITDEERQIFIDEVFELWQDCVTEFFDPKYTRRTHGKAKTYQFGCRGPFCMDATRRQRRNNGGHMPTSKYIYVEPVIEYFMDLILTAKEESHTSLQEELLSTNPTERGTAK